MELDRAIEYSNSGKLDKALDIFLKEISSDSTNPDLNYNIALVYIKKGMYKEAITHLETALEGIECYEIYLELGKCYTYLEDLNTAEAFLLKALNIEENFDTLNTLGVVHFKKENYQRALDYFKLSLDINPSNPDALFNIADTYSQLGLKKDEKWARNKLKGLTT